MRYEELTIEGRNAVLEAFRSGKTIDKLFVLQGRTGPDHRKRGKKGRYHHQFRAERAPGPDV